MALTSFSIRVLGGGDAAVFRNVAEGVFDNPVDARLVEEFLTDSRHHMVVALASGQIVGMASGVHYVHPDKPAELWINEVGVPPAFQAQGIGKQLVRALLDRGSELGCVEAWLGTEASNTAARRLYAATGGKEEAMVYVTFPLEDRREHDAS
jgi:aminoglycoside 6'-N-acetyltransferase I